MRRINLLPGEIAVQRRARRQTSLLIILFVVWIVLLGAVWLIRQGQLRQEEERLAAAQARARTLEAQIAELQQFADLERAVKLKEQILQTAMAGDVAWSRLLIELSMIIPGESWLTSFNGAAVAAAPPAAPPPGQPAPPVSLGTLNFSVVTVDGFPGVAKWLTRMPELKSLQNIWVPSATKGLIGAREVVSFPSTSELSGEAASGRYQP